MNSWPLTWAYRPTDEHLDWAEKVWNAQIIKIEKEDDLYVTHMLPQAKECREPLGERYEVVLDHDPSQDELERIAKEQRAALLSWEPVGSWVYVQLRKTDK